MPVRFRLGEFIPWTALVGEKFPFFREFVMTALERLSLAHVVCELLSCRTELARQIYVVAERYRQAVGYGPAGEAALADFRAHLARANAELIEPANGCFRGTGRLSRKQRAELERAALPARRIAYAKACEVIAASPEFAAWETFLSSHERRREADLDHPWDDHGTVDWS